jgi:hypothetical protein
VRREDAGETGLVVIEFVGLELDEGGFIAALSTGLIGVYGLGRDRNVY